VCQADSSTRPLRRRAERMARPARVRMRVRKPCVRLRRRLLGWNVRLLTGLSRCSVSSHALRRTGTAADVSDPPTLRGQSQPEQTPAQNPPAPGPCPSTWTRSTWSRLADLTTGWTRSKTRIALPTSTNAP
jgi:hypothetical protein